MKKLYILFFTLFTWTVGYSQIGKQWDKTFGGDQDDYVTTTILTEDGGYLIGGYSNSASNGDKSEASRGGYDYWVVKIDANGTKEWDKRFGGSDNDFLFAVLQTTDGYLLAGHSYSGAGGDKSQGSQGQNDYWVVKIDKDGAKQWDKRFGGSNFDYLTAVIKTADGNLLLAGYSNSPFGGDKSYGLYLNSAYSDFWIVKINSVGDKLWDNASGTQYEDVLTTVVETVGEFALGGYFPYDGNTSDIDFIIIKVNNTDGKYKNDNNYGGAQNDYISSIVKTTDGFLLGGFSESGILASKSEASRGGYDYWVVKVNTEGEQQWDRTFGGGANDNLMSMVQTADNGFLLGGESYSVAGGDKSEGSRGDNDYWVVKINSAGDKQWDKRYGGGALDHLHVITKTSDNNFLLTGQSASAISGDKTQASKGNGDFWAVKLIDAPIVTAFSPSNGAENIPITANLTITFSESIVKGTTGDIKIKSGTTTLQTIPVTNAAVTVSGSVVTINPPTDLPSSTVITVEIPGAAFKDGTNNSYAGTSAWSFKTAAAADVTAPTVSVLAPANGATGILATANLEITFNENIQKGTGDILIKSPTATLQTINVSNAAITISGNTVTIDPGIELPSSVELTIQIPAGAFKDLAGNNYAGISTWKFTTIVDNTPPVFVAPTPSIANIGTTTLDIEVKLNEGGKVYYVIVPDGTMPTPTSAQVKAGTITTFKAKGSATIAANTSISLAVIGLQAGTSYDIYIVAEDTKPNLQEAATKLDIVTLVQDTQAPIVATFQPAATTTKVALDANLVMVFSEKIKAGSGNITINAGGNTVQTLSVRDAGIVNITDKTVTINPVKDLDLNKKIDIQMPAGIFKDEAGNSYAGISNATTWTFQTTNASTRITQKTLPEEVVSTGAAITAINASITLNQNPAGTKVAFYSKSISRSIWTKKDNLTVSSGTTFTESLQDKSFDEIGLQYYFEITSPNISEDKVISDTTTAVLKYTGGLSIAGLQFGDVQKDYQIIAVPLELTNKATSNVFKDLGTYDDTKWRLFRYQNDGTTGSYQENTKGLANIETGSGYWLIVKDDKNINVGEGATVHKNSGNPFVFTLKKGWNLIGNPYNLDVSWDDVKAANTGVAGFGDLRVFENGSFQNGTVLRKFRGAFVNNTTTGDLTIKIPTQRNTALNGARTASVMKRHDENSVFEVNFNVQSREIGYKLGGLGMHQDASQGADSFDDFTLPRFIKYVDINFTKPVSAPARFTKDMIPVADSHIWEFTVETNLEKQPIELSWENYVPQLTEQQLYLYDVDRQISVNMLEQDRYTFFAASSTNFRVYYGKPDFIRQFIKSADYSSLYSYPNPFAESTLISFTLPVSPKPYDLHIQIYNSIGQPVLTLTQDNYRGGLYQVTWNGRDQTGNRLPAGVYIGKIQAVTEKERKQYAMRLIIK